MGLKGWQWLFILEAVPALILSVVVFFYLTDRPAEADMAGAGRARLAGERACSRSSAKRETVRQLQRDQALLNPKVLALSLVYFGAVATNYGLSFFLPQIVKAFGVSNVQAGLITALPYVVGVDQHRLVGTALRSQAGAALPSRLSAVRGICRHRRFHRARRSDDEDGWRCRSPGSASSAVCRCSGPSRPRSCAAPPRPAASR